MGIVRIHRSLRVITRCQDIDVLSVSSCYQTIIDCLSISDLVDRQGMGLEIHCHSMRLLHGMSLASKTVS
jgi:hypothetical protein